MVEQDPTVRIKRYISKNRMKIIIYSLSLETWLTMEPIFSDAQ